MPPFLSNGPKSEQSSLDHARLGCDDLGGELSSLGDSDLSQGFPEHGERNVSSVPWLKFQAYQVTRGQLELTYLLYFGSAVGLFYLVCCSRSFQ